MKIFRTAIDESLLKNTDYMPDGTRFNRIFKNRDRVVIPFLNDKLRNIIEQLESGNTKSKVSYKVDVGNKIARRIKDGKLDPRPMRIGKVIFHELGQKTLDEWSEAMNSVVDGNYSIIISRNPIDILRMSDHSKITSCHSPWDNYFHHAVQEAKSGGAIAYVVENDELSKILSENPDFLAQDEIFKDSQRGIDGINPVSRMRINRYTSEDEELEIAIPATSTYPYTRPIFGFYDNVKKWVKDKQPFIDKIDDDTFQDLIRQGGGYADDQDERIFKKFFDGDSKGITGQLKHSGIESQLEMWDQEISQFVEYYNDKTKNVKFDASVDESDGMVYIFVYANIRFQFIGQLLKEEDSLSKLSILFNRELKLSDEGSIEQSDIQYEDGFLNVDIVLHPFESPDNPNDVEYFFGEMEKYEENYYIDDYKNLFIALISEGIISMDSQRHPEFIIPDDKTPFELEVNMDLDISPAIVQNSLNTIKQTIYGEIGTILNNIRLKFDLKHNVMDYPNNIDNIDILPQNGKTNMHVKFGFNIVDLLDPLKILIQNYISRNSYYISEQIKNKIMQEINSELVAKTSTGLYNMNWYRYAKEII